MAKHSADSADKDTKTGKEAEDGVVKTDGESKAEEVKYENGPFGDKQSNLVVKKGKAQERKGSDVKMRKIRQP